MFFRGFYFDLFLICLCMHQMHCFACVRLAHSKRVSLEQTGSQSAHATALKPPHKAGRRGGESIARQRWCALLKIIV